MTNTGLAVEQLNKSINLMQKLQGTHFVLMTSAWAAHWNVTGAGFAATHEFLKTLYEAEQERVDACAERIRALGGSALDTLHALLEHSTIADLPAMPVGMEQNAILQHLADKWEATIRTVRDCRVLTPQDDFATASMLDQMLEQMEKEAWMLNAHIPAVRTE